MSTGTTEEPGNSKLLVRLKIRMRDLAGSFHEYRFKILPLTFWSLFLICGFGKLFSYANTPGTAALAPQLWPVQSQIKKSHSLPTLVIFVHPQCPCSVATIGELERLMPHLKEKVECVVMFFKPKNKPTEWAQGSLWTKVQNIPGVMAVLDVDGIEAEKFEAQTSGQTFLYSKDGALAFNGGITPARGHMGDSPGRDIILQFLATGKPGVNIRSPLFGCSIRNSHKISAKGTST